MSVASCRVACCLLGLFSTIFYIFIFGFTVSKCSFIADYTVWMFLMIVTTMLKHIIQIKHSTLKKNTNLDSEVLFCSIVQIVDMSDTLIHSVCIQCYKSAPLSLHIGMLSYHQAVLNGDLQIGRDISHLQKSERL